MIKNPPAGIIKGSANETTLDLRNILNTRVYLDSAIITLPAAQAKLYSVKVHENIATDIKHLEVGENTTLHFDISPPNVDVLNATVRVYTHSANWMDFKPTELQVGIEPAATSSVAGSIQTTSFATAYPNPFSTFVTISFALPKRADITLRVYDDLGRLVKDLADQNLDAGAYHMRFDGTDVPRGHYYYELNSTDLGLSERGSLVLTR